MPLTFMFFVNSLLMGVGLAMDAFSVSVANGLADPRMRRGKHLTIAVTFAVFQAAVPLFGWFFVHTILSWFSWLEGLIPWISLVLLSVIGGKMIYESARRDCDKESCELPAVRLGWLALILQGIATSIDALSVGLTIAEYPFGPALLEAVIIAAVTFFICFLGVYLGRRFGDRFSGKAEIAGGVILIAIGIEIFLTGILS